MNKKKGIGQLVVYLLLLCFFGGTALFGLGSDHSGSIADIKQGLDLAGGVSITYQVVDEDVSAEDLADTVYKLQRRVENYSTEAEVYTEGGNRINVDIPGVSDANAILEEMGQPGTLSFQLTDGTEVINGNHVANAQPYSTTNQTTRAVEYGVQLTLNDDGAALFAEATAANIGKTISIIYDGNVLSSPVVRSAITGTTCEITGMSSYEEASNLASSIRIGALPLELKELRSEVVGAKLGQQAVSTSLIAAAIAIGLIMVFMIVLYRICGVAASLALALYVAMLVMLLSTFQATLTLSGIAGIVLSIGMAVDANVIIFSRIREEIAQDRSVKGAIKAGFDKALSAIIDGNVTTLIAAVVLYMLGSGTVRGFAITLGIGVVLSMFTALTITRLLLNAFYNLGIEDEKFYGRAKPLLNFDVVGKKGAWFGIALLVIAIGVGSMGIHGANGYALNYGLDFVGGTSTSVMLNEDLTIDEIHSQVLPIVNETVSNAGAQANKVTGSNQVIIKTRELTLEERTALDEALCEEFGIEEDAIQTSNISGTIGSEMRRAAVEAVLVALVLMLLYIWIRFRDIRFAAGAILALAHDVLVVLTAYALARWTVGNPFIACILTVVGYSINATIVIFDRIRENLAEAADKTSLKELVNRSVMQTMTRSINTTITTFIAVLMLVIFGVENMRSFALPLMVGVISGAYSSVFLAGNLWLLLHKKDETVGDLKKKENK